MCGKSASRAYRPFCSKACADVDLGRWLGGRYVLPGEPIGARDEAED
ncbi:MAG: DNA gyrase inhibitor YacG [Methyloceanibacter sp.]